MTDSLRLAPITPDNLDAACGIRVSAEQDDYVASVRQSLAEAYASYQTAWPRLIMDGDQVVGFVMGGFDPDSELDFFRCGIWRLNVDVRHQGAGYGRFAVEALIEEARRRGSKRVTVMWKRGEHGPENFYLKVGFVPTGQEFYGQVVGEMFID